MSAKNRSSLVGGVERRRIEIVDYDSRWPDVFHEHARRIAATLGNGAVRIDHIGSTSVPGLAAKPIIDILIVVVDSADEASYVPHLERVGYELRVREPEFHEHRMLRTIAHDVHIHVYSGGSPEIDRYLRFRDRLRCDPDDRRLYAETKRKLAQQPWPDMDAYAQAKTEVIEAIIARAQ